MNWRGDMKMTDKAIKTLFSSPLWAITPEAFSALLLKLSQNESFAIKPALGKVHSNKVAVIPVQGVLTKDCSWCGTTYASISSGAEEAASDPAVKHIVLAVDSPGGEVTGLPETAAVIRRVANVKPVHAVVEGTSASAAYWLTSQATDITLTPSGEVGSVGVRMMHMDISKMLNDAGIKITELSAGTYKTEWSPFHPLCDEAKADMQQRLDAVHANFLKDIGEGRGTRAGARIRANRFGEGRMFSSAEALRHGLVDNLQSPREFYRAVSRYATDERPAATRLQRARLELTRLRQ
jgi:signal peptide peptidase SppA